MSSENDNAVSLVKEKDDDVTISNEAELEIENSARENLSSCKDENDQQTEDNSELSHEVSQLVPKLHEASRRLFENDLKIESDQLKRIYDDALRNKFVVSVVGEFSKGKSTFINRLLERDILPAGNLPTTALLTRINFAPENEEVIEHLDEYGKVIESKSELTQEAWDDLVADNFNNQDPKGSALVKVHNEWLGKYNIELVDSPGAGDLNENRAKQVGDALMSSDGVIIAISATQALSLSEKVFIEQRVVSRRIPFLMMIVTKLDLAKLEERNTVINYIKNKLKLWNLEDKIPVYIPSDIELPDSTYDDIRGYDKIKSAILSWIQCPERTQLTESWIKSRVNEVIKGSKKIIQEQIAILDADDERGQRLVDDKKCALSRSEIFWNSLCIEMGKRKNECLNKFCTEVEDSTVKITERLQNEAVNAQNPKKWWDDNYQYRLKIELGNLGGYLGKLISKIALNDAQWISQELQKTFNVVISDSAFRENPEVGVSAQSKSNVELDDVDSKITKTRIGAIALGSVGALLLGAAGVAMTPIVFTMGIGMGTSILAKNLFKKAVKEQHDTLKKAIADDVRRVIDEATAESQNRIEAIYDALLSEADEKKVFWLRAQEAAIEDSCLPKTKERRDSLTDKIDCLENIALQFT